MALICTSVLEIRSIFFSIQYGKKLLLLTSNFSILAKNMEKKIRSSSTDRTSLYHTKMKKYGANEFSIHKSTEPKKFSVEFSPKKYGKKKFSIEFSSEKYGEKFFSVHISTGNKIFSVFFMYWQENIIVFFLVYWKTIILDTYCLYSGCNRAYFNNAEFWFVSELNLFVMMFLNFSHNLN